MSAVTSMVNVTRDFRVIRALDNVSFDVENGESVTVLGPNGAGKTTAIDVMLGAIKPTVGTARLFGLDPRSAAARRRIGITPQQLGFPSALTTAELLDFLRAHYPKPMTVADSIHRYGLEEIAARRIGELSAGQVRRIAIAAAFVGNPDAVFLDEPTNSLDVEMRRATWSNLREYVKGGGTLFLTTHNMDEAESLATRVIILLSGKIVYDGSVHLLKRSSGIRKIRISGVFAGHSDAIESSSVENGITTLTTHDSDAAIRDLISQGLNFNDLEILSPSLEEALLSLTSGGA
jgi:ABC-2 type transport system ATP-binding protein